MFYSGKWNVSCLGQGGREGGREGGRGGGGGEGREGDKLSCPAILLQIDVKPHQILTDLVARNL